MPRGALLLDVGCGVGESVVCLNGLGMRALGVDRDASVLPSAESPNGGCFLAADAENLPFGENFFDGVMFECSLSKIENPSRALRESRRTLKPFGRLMISDFYARAEEVSHTGVLGRIERIETTLARVRGEGFISAAIEDCTDCLRQLWGQLILDMGRESVLEQLGAGRQSAVKYGYFLLTAQKGKSL